MNRCNKFDKCWISRGDEGVGGLKRQTILLTLKSKPWKINDACF